MRTASTLTLALAAFHKHLEVHGDFNHYAGIVSLHGMTRLATGTGDEKLIEEARRQLMPYVQGERDFFANFPNYLCGGNATAWMFYKGLLPEAEAAVRKYADVFSMRRSVRRRAFSPIRACPGKTSSGSTSPSR